MRVFARRDAILLVCLTAALLNIDAIIGRADTALYRAKEAGRDSVHAATETVTVVEVEERKTGVG